MKYTPADGYPYYFDLVADRNCKALFSSKATFTFLNSIPEEKANYRYAPEKWSIKQIIGHITDHERIKMYRAFLMSRNEKVELWGYDQNFLVANSRFDELTFQEVKKDFLNVRKASISFISCLSNRQLQIKAMARQHEISLENFLKSIVGHEMHHIGGIKEKYL